MKRVAVNQSETFQNDHFLAQLCHASDARFSLYEHAPINERRQKFRSYVNQQKLPLTFLRTGVNVPLTLEWSQDKGSEVEFRSTAFIFSGVWVKVTGTIGLENLEGKVQFEKFQQPQEEEEYMSEEQLDELRRRGVQL